MRPYFLNSRTLRDRRRELRKNQTPAESVIWSHVRNRKPGDYRFLRQYSIGPYVIDFYCPAVKLAIELDGGQHRAKDGLMYDQERDAYLKGFGAKVVRFLNAEVVSNPQDILDRILRSLSYL